MQSFHCGLSNVFICTPLVPLGIGLVYFRAKMVAIYVIRFSFVQSNKPLYTRYKRYTAGSKQIFYWSFWIISARLMSLNKCGSRWGTGGPDPPPPGSIWVSIGNKQLDPPPLEKLDPPPPPGKCWTPSGTLKSDRFL